ncbi:MAG: helix-turn-helix transcriptional regulator [Bacteroidota bacterium]
MGKQVIRKYFIKSLLLDMEDWQRAKTRKDLCEQLGISKAYLSKLINTTEDSPRSLSAEQLQTVAEVMGVSMETIMEPYCDHVRTREKVG